MAINTQPAKSVVDAVIENARVTAIEGAPAIAPATSPFPPVAPGGGANPPAGVPIPDSAELTLLKRDHPELYAAYVKHFENGYESNERIFRSILDAMLFSHRSTVIMYWALFVLGIGLFGVGAWLSVDGNGTAGAVFGGLSVVSFLTYFVSRPTQALEENLMYITWLGILYNSYWTHLAWTFNRKSSLDELQRATTVVTGQLALLVDRHAKSVSARPGLLETLTGSKKLPDPAPIPAPPAPPAPPAG